MKHCASPSNTRCMYQRIIARDQADPDDDGAQAGASSDAYEALAKFLASHLDPDDLGEAEVLLRHFIDQSGDGHIAADEPPPFSGRPRFGPLAHDHADLVRRAAVGVKISAGKAQRSFNARFPGAARVRVIG
jgi:hypothetical protein